MRVAFRADASREIGTGHVMRCLTLADALQNQNAECQFVCRELEEHLIGYIEARGYKVHALPKGNLNFRSKSNGLYTNLLGVECQEDAQQTRQSIKGWTPDWLIVDHYALDHIYESALYSCVKQIMAIDDLANRQHNCEILLDQNYGSSIWRYAGLVPNGCNQLHGPEFAILNPVYAQRRKVRGVRKGKVENVLIYFGGGADPLNLNGMALNVFQARELSKVWLDIVVGSAYAYKEELDFQAANRGRTRIHSQLHDLSELMVNADLAVGAGGSTTWERCCVGLPSIVISIAENQRMICESLAADGLIEYLGHYDKIRPRMLFNQAADFLRNPRRLDELSEKSMKIVDGEGAKRVLKEIVRSAS